MQTEKPKMAKKSIGNIMRKRLSDITNSSQSQQDNNNQPLSLDNNSIQQLLKERANLINLLAERNKMLERSGAELQRMRADMKKLQMQNWNLAQSNSLMLAELNLGRDKIKTLQHEILWRAALINGKTFNMQEKVEIDSEKNASLSQLKVEDEKEAKEEDEKEAHPSPITSNDEKQCCLNRRRIRSRSTGSSTASTSTKNTGKEKVKDNRRRRSLRRHSATSKVHQHEPLENLFEIEDAQYAITQSDKPISSSAKTERRENSCLRNEAPRHSFGRPLRRAAEKIPSYKEIPLNVKMRRLA
ncbi:shugoshin-1-like isoform X1 [Trifolium pratense]|uniref:shugoshin-1-like isoform X1 n=1 Tax=Trifolium pratense TaxID=57577 RepID=UPI001E696D52|nr:shugoshin-1-like isoform X1 [Trifolium pratense]